MTSDSPAAGRKSPGHAVIKGRPATAQAPRPAT
jgi:hypothetical protein